MARIVRSKPAARGRTECERSPGSTSTYAISLDAVEFHLNALRYRAGLPHQLNAEEQQLCRHARNTVRRLVSEQMKLGDWMVAEEADPSPAMVQALAIELQALQAA